MQMKFTATVIIAMLIGSVASAQEFRPFMFDHCEKLSDVIAEYKKTHPDFDAPESGTKALSREEQEEEGSDFQFRRAVWYWQRHLDEDGYMVPDGRRRGEWLHFVQSTPASNNMAKATANKALWTLQGPDRNDSGVNMGTIGFASRIAFHPTDSNTFWAAAGVGGAWKTVNNGQTWTCMSDNLAIGTISDIVINPLNPRTVYLAGPFGVLKSYNGGASWQGAGLSWISADYKFITSMVISRADTNVLLVTGRDSVYRSSNGGATWRGVRPGQCYSLVCHPQNPSLIFLASYSNYAPFISGQIFRSADNGVTWSQTSNFTAAVSIQIAVTPASARVVKAVSTEVNGGLDAVWSSSDTGRSFRKVFSNAGGCSSNYLNVSPGFCGGQGGYNLAIAISPVDTNRVYIGGMLAALSTNGGQSWQYYISPSAGIPSANGYVIHPDIHFIAHSPLRSSRLYVCNDGGIAKTESVSTDVWTDITPGMSISQLYKIGVSSKASYVLAGEQDCGARLIRSYTAPIRSVYSGDATLAALDWADSNTFYAGTQLGNTIARFTRSGSTITNVDIRANLPGSPNQNSWVTPFIVHPVHHDSLVILYNGIYLSRDRGDHWALISNAIPNPQDIRQIALTPADANTVYAAQAVYPADSFIIWTSYNLGRTWTSRPCPFRGEVSSITVDPKDKTHFWITMPGYYPVRVAEFTTAGGWKNISANLPNVPVNAMVIDSSNGETYIGNDLGVFLYNSSTSQWDLYNKNLPVVAVNDLAINYQKNEIWAATWGRSIWKSPKNFVTPVAVQHPSQTTAPKIIVSPNPATDRLVIEGLAGGTATIINSAGQEIIAFAINTGAESVSIATLPPGIYVLRLRDSFGDRGSISIIKQ